MLFRVRAFLVHLAFCLVIAVLALMLVFYIWYPSPLDVATGVAKIFILLLICDIILGPVLTLIIANPEKKHLKWDISFIVIIQAAALIYGLLTVEGGRPVWLVFSVDRFDLVQSYELNNPYQSKASSDYSGKNWFGPRWVAARAPQDIEELNNLTFEALLAGLDIPQRPDLYVPLSDEFAMIIQKSRPLSELNLFNSADQVTHILKRHPAATDFLPMMSRAKPMTVLIDRNERQIVAVVDLVPWE